MQPRALATGALAAALLCLCIPASLAAPQTGPAIDASHAMMEPPPAKQPRPYVRPPAGSRLAAGSGVYRKLLSVSTPRSAATLAAAAVTITCLVSRSAASRLVLHIMCFIGSLLEPFDSVLPKRSALRPFIEQVKSARRAYAVKHGLPLDLDAMEGFADEAVEAAAEAEEGRAEAPAEAEAAGEEAAAEEGAAAAAPSEGAEPVEV